MSKVYKPVIKDGDHILRSKGNPERVRGLARDQENKNPDIIEWEEYDMDDLFEEEYGFSPYEYRYNNGGYDPNRYNDYSHLSKEEQEAADEFAEEVATAVFYLGALLFEEVVIPWWKSSAWPWLKDKGKSVKETLKSKRNRRIKKVEKHKKTDTTLDSITVVSDIDEIIESCFIDLDEDEAKEHMIKLIYHMLGVVNEIKILSNAHLKKKCESEIEYNKKKTEMERFLIERVSMGLDQLLSDDTLKLDMDTSRDLFMLTGGGIRLKGKYIPVQNQKIEDALRNLSIQS